MSLSDIPKVSDALIKLVTFMTWPRFLKTTATLIFAISMWTLFENRQSVYTGLIASKGSVTMIEAPVGEATVKAVNEILSKAAGKVVAVQFVSVDFKTNTRATVYFESTNANMNMVMSNFQNRKLTDTAFFNQDTQNNERNTAIINGEFICSKLVDIAVFQRAPQLRDYSDIVCSVSLPPYPGFFSGYVNIYIKGSLVGDELADIRTAARKLAIVAYDLDVRKQ